MINHVFWPLVFSLRLRSGREVLRTPLTVLLWYSSHNPQSTHLSNKRIFIKSQQRIHENMTEYLEDSAEVCELTGFLFLWYLLGRLYHIKILADNRDYGQFISKNCSDQIKIKIKKHKKFRSCNEIWYETSKIFTCHFQSQRKHLHTCQIYLASSYHDKNFRNNS